jgi:hypothetical protein
MTMKTIWKFNVTMEDTFEVKMPKGAQVLTVQEQYDEPQMWVVVDTEAPKEKRRFRLVGTGHPIDEKLNLSYIGTFQLDHGEFMGHLFEIL